MKYESHFLNPEQSKTSIRSRIPKKLTFIPTYFSLLNTKMQTQVSLFVNLNTKIWCVGIQSNLPDYPIIFFLCLGRRFFFLPQTRISKRRLEKWEHWNFGTNCFPSQVLLQRPAVAAALSCAVVKYSVSIWKIAMDGLAPIGDEEGVQLKPIPWFRSNTEPDTQIGLHRNRYWNQI